MLNILSTFAVTLARPARRGHMDWSPAVTRYRLHASLVPQESTMIYHKARHLARDASKGPTSLLQALLLSVIAFPAGLVGTHQTARAVVLLVQRATMRATRALHIAHNAALGSTTANMARRRP